MKAKEYKSNSEFEYLVQEQRHGLSKLKTPSAEFNDVLAPKAYIEKLNMIYIP